MDELPDFLKPRLRLFLSADIVGSTALKQSPRDRQTSSAEWFAIIQSFYSEAQSLFLGKWAELATTDRHNKLGPAPEFWKVIGDEITFVKVVTEHKQVAAAIKCWIDAVQELRQAVKSRSSRLDVKCTAWIAGFPVMNKEVVVSASKTAPGSANYYKESGELLNAKYRREPVPELIVDYIGPAIDIGFRLGSYASSRKFVISVGTAYILSLTNAFFGSDRRISFEGAVTLKGVFGGARYPIFWIDMAGDDDLARLEDRLTGQSSCERETIRGYCTRFFKENESYTFPPFIDSPSETEITDRPTWYDADLKLLAANYAMDEVADRQSEQEAETSSEARDDDAAKGSRKATRDAVLTSREVDELLDMLGLPTTSKGSPKKSR